MVRAIFISLAVMLGSCTSAPGTGEAKTENFRPNEAGDNNTPAFSEQAYDSLNRDSVLVNGIIPFTSTQEQVLKTLGKPESITRPMYECGGYEEGDSLYGDLVQLYHYGRTTFVTYKNKADLHVLDMHSGKFFLQTPGIKLDGNTSFEEIKKAFPKAAGDAYPRPKDNANGRYILVNIPPTKFGDDAWILTFEEDKLIRIEYWISC